MIDATEVIMMYEMKIENRFSLGGGCSVLFMLLKSSIYSTHGIINTPSKSSHP